MDESKPRAVGTARASAGSSVVCSVVGDFFIVTPIQAPNVATVAGLSYVLTYNV